MKIRLPRLVLLALVLCALVAAYQYRNQIVKAPRVRVGALMRDEPVPTGRPLRFFALGDTGTGGEAQHAVAAVMEKRCQEAGVDGILLLGDNAYQSGVESVDDPQWQSKILGPYETDCLQSKPIYPVLGNHDYKGNPSAQIEYSLLSPRWRFPNRFYSVRYGDLARIVAYDTETSEFCFRPAYCSVDFLLDTVARQDATWMIAMGHHPLRTASSKYDEPFGGLRGLLLAPLLCNQVDLYLSGHAHHMERRKFDDCRMELVISGGGGGDLYPVEEGDPDVYFARSTYGFAEIEMIPESMTLRFYASDGTLLHEVTRTKPGAPRPSP